MKPISLEALKTYATRYRGRDGKERVVMFQEHYEALLAMIERRDKLVLHMVNTFRRLGMDSMARIDARAMLVRVLYPPSAPDGDYEGEEMNPMVEPVTTMNPEWKDCGNVQCAQVHAVLDSLLQWLEVECPDNIYSVGKSVRIVDSITKLKAQKQWRTDSLKDAHDDKGKLHAEIHDLRHEITAAQFVKFWDGLSFKQHCLLAAQSLLKAASLVE